MFKSVIKNRSSRREEALIFRTFEPRHLGCYEVLKAALHCEDRPANCSTLGLGHWALVILALCLVASSTAAPALTDLNVSPANVRLSTQQDRQSLVVQAVYADGVTRDVTDKASFAVADQKLARLAGATVHPVGDGKTELVVKFEGRSLKVPVTIEQAKMERSITFKLDVVPALTKAGCNSGGCHGASRGKDGFRLSLFGYDPDGDYARITREQIGRRINLAIPRSEERRVGKECCR